MNNIEVDKESVRELQKKLSQLSSKNQKKAYREALREGGRIIGNKAKYYLRAVTDAANHKNWWDGKTLASGIVVRVNRDITAATISILRDFRLKFFQDGTKQRTTLGRKTDAGRSIRIKTNKRIAAGANRGRIKPTNFFIKAQESTEKNVKELLDRSISKAINKAWENQQG